MNMVSPWVFILLCQGECVDSGLPGIGSGDVGGVRTGGLSAAARGGGSAVGNAVCEPVAASSGGGAGDAKPD